MLRPTLSLLNGFQLPFEGGRMLVAERSLWAPAAVPAGFSLCAFAAATALLFGFSGELYSWATQWMPVLEAGAWYSWIWIGPARVGLTLIGGLLFAAIAVVGLLLAFLAANVLASPFLDVLSERVERIVSGGVEDRAPSGLLGTASDVLRSVREELKRTLFFAAVVGALSLAGVVIPGAQLLTGPALVAFAVFFLPLDYSSYALDRRRFSFADKRRWLVANRAAACGFGGAAFLICAVPVLNFIAMPILVIGGTLLALRAAGRPSDAGQAGPG